MQKVISSTIDFTTSKNDIFYDDNNDSDIDSKWSLNNDDKYNDNSESNRDDDDEIEKKLGRNCRSSKLKAITLSSALSLKLCKNTNSDHEDNDNSNKNS